MWTTGFDFGGFRCDGPFLNRFNGKNPKLCPQKKHKKPFRNMAFITLPETNVAPENGWLEY